MTGLGKVCYVYVLSHITKLPKKKEFSILSVPFILLSILHFVVKIKYFYSIYVGQRSVIQRSI